MPFWTDDCPFYESYECWCKLGNTKCEYIMNHTAGHREEDDCPWLTTRNGNKEE